MWPLSISRSVQSVLTALSQLTVECNLSSTCVLCVSSCACLTPLTLLSAQGLYMPRQVPAIRTQGDTEDSTEKVSFYNEPF